MYSITKIKPPKGALKADSMGDHRKTNMELPLCLSLVSFPSMGHAWSSSHIRAIQANVSTREDALCETAVSLLFG